MRISRISSVRLANAISAAVGSAEVDSRVVGTGSEAGRGTVFSFSYIVRGGSLSSRVDSMWGEDRAVVRLNARRRQKRKAAAHRSRKAKEPTIEPIIAATGTCFPVVFDCAVVGDAFMKRVILCSMIPS